LSGLQALAVDKVLLEVLVEFFHHGFVLEQVAIVLDTLQINGVQLMHEAL